MKKYFSSFLPAILFLGFISIQGQGRSTANIPINVSLLKGIQVSTLSGDLDFGEIVKSGVSSKLTKKPGEGVLIEVNGHPGKSVIVEYTNPLLANFDAVGINEPVINFNPVLTSSPDQNYIETSLLKSSSSMTLADNNGYGKQYIWVGGELEIDKDAPHGNYQGTLTLTISY